MEPNRKGNGFHSPLPLPSSEVTHVVMEQTSVKEAICWQEHMAAALPCCPRPALLDICWFTESMAAGQPVPVEDRHCLKVSQFRPSSVGTGEVQQQCLSAFQRALLRSPGVLENQQRSHDELGLDHPSFCPYHLRSTYV